MLRVAICDDERNMLNFLCKRVEAEFKKHRQEVRVVPFLSVNAMLSQNMENKFDVIFLDIIMPLLNGMETARELRQHDTAVKIIFLTTSPEFALESYEVKAQDYLLKPLNYERLAATLEECSRTIQVEPPNFVLKTTYGYQKLYYYDIEFAEAQNKRVIFYLRSGRTAETTAPLYSFEEKLTDCNDFFKCHRSYLVYLPNVDHFNGNEIITKSGRSVPIARGYGKAFQEAYFAQMFREDE